MKTLSLLAVATVLSTWPAALSAQQSESMYERGATYLENTMPPSPEPASVVKYADVPFTHSSGMAEYDVPFYTLQGRELSIPIGLHYASGGIKLDEIAGVAGLGWTLNAGGCITRTVMDMPDEFTSPVMRHEMPSDSLLADLKAMTENIASMSYLRDVLWHRIDASLDRYSYSVCGMSGSFVIQDDGSVFQLSGDGVLIDYTSAADGSVDVFTVTGPDGTVYTFSVKETGTHDGQGDTPPTPTSGEQDRWSATTAWHISSMRSRSGLESASFTYSAPAEWKRVVRSRTQTVTMDVNPDIQEDNRAPEISYSSKNIYSTYSAMVLAGISLNGVDVSFGYTGYTSYCHRTDYPEYQQNFPFTLNEISVRSSGNPVDLARMELSCGAAPYDGRILLNSIRLYRGEVLDGKWAFTYRNVGCTVSHGSQDWYGYYNGENEFSDSGTVSTRPYEYSHTGGFALTNGFPSPVYADYMSLIAVDNDGAVTRYTYEGSTITSMNNSYSVGIRVKSIILPHGLLSARVRYFTYESPVSSGPYVPAMEHYLSTAMSVVPNPSSLVITYRWQFTIHDSPVSLGPSLPDTRIYYEKVTEDVTGRLLLQTDAPSSFSNTSRTVYKYSSDGIQPPAHNEADLRFPDEWEAIYNNVFSVPPICDPWTGIRKYYTENNPSVSPVLERREEYAYEDDAYRLVSSTTYTYDEPSSQSVLVDYYTSQVVNHWSTGQLEYDYIYHFPVYAHSRSGRNPVREVRVGYHACGNDTTVVNTSYVARTSMSSPVRVSSAGTTEAGTTRMVSYGYADTWSGGSWASALRAQHCLSVPLNVKQWCQDVTSLQLSAPLKEMTSEYSWITTGGQQHLLPSGRIEKNLGTESWRESVLSRDCMGNISSLKEKGRPETVVIWSYAGRYPVAVVENATAAAVSSAMGGQTVIDAITLSDTLTQTHLDALAALRAALPQAHVTAYTHLPGVGVTSMTDPAGMKTTYEYDHAGRLACIRDNDGNKVEEYDYSLMADENKRRHMRSRVFRSSDGTEFAEDVSWWDVFGRKTQDIAVGASGNGYDLVTAYGSDFMFHDDVKTWLPYPVQNTAGAFQASAESLAADHHGNNLAYSFKNYELSSRDRVVSTALPGYAGEHETSFDTDVAEGFPIYVWEDDGVVLKGTYQSDCIVIGKTVNADGRLVSTYKDHAGRTLATSNGDDAPTYYIYDLHDRLCAVRGSGIEMTDTLNMWRYSYDSLGRLASKGIPGSVREHYTYDEEDRLVSVLRDGTLKEMEYDAMGRMTKVWQTLPGGQRMLLEEHTYDVYPAGVSGSDPKGLKTISRLAEIAPDGSTAGTVRVYYSYDEKKRPVSIRTRYQDGSEMVEQLQYTFAGEVASSTTTYMHGTRMDKLVTVYAYDRRGRLTVETATLTPSGSSSQTAEVNHGYDVLGRPAGAVSIIPGRPGLVTSLSYTLQGWVDTLSVSLGNSPLFFQSLGYDAPSDLSGYVPQYSGMVSIRSERWHPSSGAPIQSQDLYVYDHAGRLNKEYADDHVLTCMYDARGNMQSARRVGSTGQFNQTYVYDGDRLKSMTLSSTNTQDIVSFAHDALGRMTFDGTTGQSMAYNSLDLVGNITGNGTTLVNYSYLSDGTKLSALDGSGEGLVYRGPFVYRKSSGSSSLTLESAAFGGGRLTPAGAMLYVRDYLGSVRAVVDGKTGQLYKAADYSAFGEESAVMVPAQGSAPAHPLATAAMPSGLTLRDGYTGKEAQDPDFSTGYTDFGARQYNPALRRWMTPDPLSEKYYGISPYAFCNNNPVNLVDPDGRRLYFADGVSDVFKQKFAATIQFMNSKGTAGDLASLHDSDVVYYMAEIKQEDLRPGENNSIFDHRENTIYWDYTHFALTDSDILLSPATVLAHEAAHAVRYDKAVKNGTEDQWIANAKDGTDSQYDSIEERAVITTTEQEVALKHGEIEHGQVTRTNHKGERYKVTVADGNPENISTIAYEHNILMK